MRIGVAISGLPSVDQFVNQHCLQLRQVIQEADSDEDQVFAGRAGGCGEFVIGLLAGLREHRLLQVIRQPQGRQDGHVGRKLPRHGREM